MRVWVRGEPRRGSSQYSSTCWVPCSSRQRYLVFDRYLYRLQSQTLYLYLDRSYFAVLLLFLFCFFSYFVFGKLQCPSPPPNDWQFPASPLAQSLSAFTISPCLTPPLVVAVNCVQLCINECIWPRARTQVWEFLHEMLHALAPAGLTMRSGVWRDDRFSTWTETIRKSINFLIARYDRMLR